MIYAPENRLEFEVEIFVQAIYELLASHGYGMTDNVYDGQFEATLYAPRLVKGHPAGPLQGKGRDKNGLVFFLVALQLVLDSFYRRGITDFRSDDFRALSFQMLLRGLGRPLGYRLIISTGVAGTSNTNSVSRSFSTISRTALDSSGLEAVWLAKTRYRGI